MRLSRLELLRRGVALVVVSRLQLLEEAFAATPKTVRQTLDALVEFVVGDSKLVAATTPRLVRTLDRFLPGALPLSTTASSILNASAEQVKAGAAFAQLSAAQKQKVFETIESLPAEGAGSIQFLVGNLQDLTAFLAYSTPRGRRLSRYTGPLHGHKEFKGYWQGRRAAGA
jgi:hypothetical protein